MIALFVLLALGMLTGGTTLNTFRIAGLFPPGQTADVAFQNSVREASFNLKHKTGNKLDGILFDRDNVNDSYIIRIDVCQKLKQGIIGVFGPSAGESTSIVQSICDAKDTPRIQVHYESNMYRSSCLINLYPHPSALAKAYAAIIHKLGWKSFIIVYEDNESLMRISELLKPEINGGAIVRLYQLTPPNHRRMLHKIRNTKETKILLDCSRTALETVLNQAQQVGIMTAEYKYIITCMDLHTLDLEQYKYSGVNITGFRLFDPFSDKINDTLQTWTINDTEHIALEQQQQQLLLVDQSARRTGTAVFVIQQFQSKVLKAICDTPYYVSNDAEAALIYDSVMLFTEAIIYHSEIEHFKQKSIDCDSDAVWNFGTSIINYMRTTELEDGLTGPIKFDSEGFRTDVELQIIELTKHGLQYVGFWNTTKGITVKKKFYNYVPDQVEIKDMKNMTFKVIVPMTNPYAMRKKSSVTLTGNDQYEGYCIDLINELSLMSGFKYTIIVQQDGNNGQLKPLPNGTQVWNGMIGKLRSGEADIALGDLTVTPERAHDVDFTYQYMDVGISILYKKPENKAPDLFSFLFPFSTDVWLLVITAYIGMSLLFFIMARLSPYEWTNPYPCIQEPEVLENQFTLSNSFWFTGGALMQQGSEIAPISTSTRIAAGFWWFFTLIMVSSYTANLAAFLTIENPISPFDNVKELANQDKIAYGLKAGGSTYTYFEESNDETYKKMFSYMTAHKDEVMVYQNRDGVEKVINEKGGYAFLMESSSVEYETVQHCELAQIGGLLDNKHYAIAVRKGSWYVGLLGRNILALQEQGKLSDFKRKWWKEKYTKNCMEKKQNDAQTLELANVGGVFLVLIAGTIIALFVMLLELLWYSWNSSKTENTTVKSKLMQELKFAGKCKTTKPVSPEDKSSILTRSSDDASANSNANNNNNGTINPNGYAKNFYIN